MSSCTLSGWHNYAKTNFKIWAKVDVEILYKIDRGISKGDARPNIQM